MPSVDWAAATDALVRAGRDQFSRFLAGPVADQVYAVGFFADALVGDVLPVANTMDQHTREFAAHRAAGGDVDQPTFLWDSGNWEFPAGLDPVGAEPVARAGADWEPLRAAVEAAAAAADEDGLAVLSLGLRRACVEALRRLAADGVFAPAANLMGYVVQSPDDLPDELVANQERVTAAVGERPA